MAFTGSYALLVDLLLYRQKLLQEEKVAPKISQLLELFLPFSSRNLYSKGYNRRPHAHY